MNLANQITIARILLVPFFVTAVVYQKPEAAYFKWIAAAIFFLASVSDAVDGYLARVREEKTALGSFLDPFADKLLLISAFLSLSFSQGFAYKISSWILIVILSREVILISGLVILFFTNREVKIHPSFLGKLTTVAQMVTVGAMLLEFWWANAIAYLAAILTIASGLGYIYREARGMNHDADGHAG